MTEEGHHGARARSHRRRVAAARQPHRLIHGDDPTAGKPLPDRFRCRRARRDARRSAPPRRRPWRCATSRSTRSAVFSTLRRASRPRRRAGRTRRARDRPARAPRLRDVELPRTTNQLRQAAAAAREGSWAQATIDTKANIRSYFGPLGPVVVFGPNNFPFAFNSVAGGDFAAAIAAGNPVIAKANTAHPGTTQLLAERHMRRRAPPGCRRHGAAHLSHAPRRRRRLVADRASAPPATPAAGAGLKLKAAADARASRSISSCRASTRWSLPGALASAAAAIAKELYELPDGGGPVLHEPRPGGRSPGRETEGFIAAGRAVQAAPAGTLLGRRVRPQSPRR